MGMADATTLDVLMGTLEGLLEATGVRSDSRARNITFDLTDLGAFSFVPRSPGRLFVRGAAPGSRLRLRCTSGSFLRLLTVPDFRVLDDEPFELTGQVEALLPIIAALDERRDPPQRGALC